MANGFVFFTARAAGHDTAIVVFFSALSTFSLQRHQWPAELIREPEGWKREIDGDSTGGVKRTGDEFADFYVENIRKG